MSHVVITASTRPSKVARMTEAVRRSWTEARYLDRRLMEMRTELSRHSG